MTRPGLAAALVGLTALCAAPALRARADEPKAPPADAKDAQKKDGGQAKDAAEKKDKKDKKGAAPGKVFTEDDLKKYSDDPEGKRKSEPAAESAPPADEPLPDSSMEHGGRQLWANRASDARDRIQDAQGKIDALETRIAALRDDVAPGRVMEPFRLQSIEADIAKAMSELEAARKELAAAKVAQEELEQEARRLGVPAGWLREP
jgi:hypothetical protein